MNTKYILAAALFFAATPTSAQRTIINEGQWQNTPSVAIDRSNPNKIAVAGWDDYADNLRIGMPVYLTEDGGATWNTQRLPRVFGWDSFGDPSIACDDGGRFYCAYSIIDYATPSACILVAASPDGVRWKNAPPIGDTTGGGIGDWDFGPNIAVDNSPQSPHYGRVYLAWTHFDTNASKTDLRLCWSDNHATSWSAPIELAAGWGAVHVQTGKNGEIFVSRTSIEGNVGEDLLAVSTDGGNTFTWNLIANILNYPYYKRPPFYDSIPGLKGTGGFETDVTITFAVDQRTNKIDAVYGSWDSVNHCAVLYTTSSTDLGATWSDSIRIDGAPYPYTDRFYPWISNDDITHQASLVYYSSEQDSNNVGTGVFRRVTGETGWSGAEALTPSPLNPLACTANMQTSIGDYIGCNAYNGVFAAAWTTSRAGPIIITGTTTGMSDLVIYVKSPNAAVKMPVKLNTDHLWLSDPFPNPVIASTTTINVVIPEATTVRLDLFDEAGRSVKTFWERTMNEGSYVLPLNLSELPTGAYYLRLSTSNAATEKQIIVTR